jgi:Mn-dependent DtxR family transcriptional regulator
MPLSLCHSLMTKEDKILVFLKLRGGSGPIDTIREAADIREAAILRQSNPLAKKLVADGLVTHPRRNHYVLTARGDARAREIIGR